jgi:hypothetical protein
MAVESALLNYFILALINEHLAYEYFGGLDDPVANIVSCGQGTYQGLIGLVLICFHCG